MKKNILIILAITLVFSSCEDLINPAKENFKDVSHMYTDASYAQGFIVNAYRSIPAYYDNSDYATDDAVTNLKTNNFLRIATGSWSARNNPVNRWTDAYGAIQYINLFLENTDKVRWAEDTAAAKLFNMRMKGEAYGLRALFMYYLLRNHAGYTDDGRLLGVPIITEFLNAQSNFNIPRATFEECVKQIYMDLDSAEAKLPDEYIDLSANAEVPERYRSITTKPVVYNRVMGIYSRQLFNGLIAKAFRARVALLAASPAFQDPSNTVTWENAADYAARVINYKGGATSLPSNGGTYYANTELNTLGNGINPPEIIWRENVQTNNSDQEAQHFPPTLFGSGNMNPTQNLVNAFPMTNGYPIDSTQSGYNPANPYTGRDPRLARYIIFNGSRAGVPNSFVYSGSASGTIDGINVKETSTRTGYYMKKRLRMDVNRNPSNIVGKNHYNPRIRYTEIYLIYAEAANEAWGPKGTGNHAYSAYNIIKAIRTRAGVGVSNGDPYLEACALDKDKMRELIRNERRLELCFESFRFWDLRRWKANLNEVATGADASNNYDVFNVEERSYEDYMYYGPIPYSEILKYNNLVQNKGWK